MYNQKNKKDELPPLYDSYPPRMKIRKDPATNVVIPTQQQVEEEKKWVDFNTK